MPHSIFGPIKVHSHLHTHTHTYTLMTVTCSLVCQCQHWQTHLCEPIGLVSGNLWPTLPCDSFQHQAKGSPNATELFLQYFPYSAVAGQRIWPCSRTWTEFFHFRKSSLFGQLVLTNTRTVGYQKMLSSSLSLSLSLPHTHSIYCRKKWLIQLTMLVANTHRPTCHQMFRGVHLNNVNGYRLTWWLVGWWCW